MASITEHINLSGKDKAENNDLNSGERLDMDRESKTMWKSTRKLTFMLPVI